MYAGISAVYYIGWHQIWQAARPEACSLDFAVPELPRLDGEIWPAPDDLASVAVHYRIFNRYMRHGSIQEVTKQVRCIPHIIPQIALVKPPDARIAQSSAGRVGNQQIPSAVQQLPRVSNNVISRRLSWQQIARPRIPTVRREGITDNAGIFAGYQHSHDGPLFGGQAGV
jgi:hypothetical protein